MARKRPDSVEEFERKKREKAGATAPRNPDLNPTRAETADRDNYIRRGQDAWKRHKADATWTDWLAIGEALDIGRTEAMMSAGTNEPNGSGYNKAFGRWLKDHGFDDIDQGDRKRLFDVMDHRSEIELWRATLTAVERHRTNHPSTVWRKWKAKTQPRTPTGPSIATQLAAAKKELGAANDRIKELGEERDGEPLTVDQHFDALIELLQDLPLKEVQARLNVFAKTLNKVSADRRYERDMIASGAVKRPDGSWFNSSTKTFNSSTKTKAKAKTGKSELRDTLDEIESKLA